jgi:hypothetical protein
MGAGWKRARCSGCEGGGGRGGGFAGGVSDAKRDFIHGVAQLRLSRTGSLAGDVVLPPVAQPGSK